MNAPPLTVALVGNPNAGKSTLFNALSGLRQHVGNYPGVTVEMKKGQFTHAGRRVELIDLPGTYSLAARSPDEMVAVDLLLGRRPEEKRPDAVLAIVDASNLDRHLYLTSQVMELGVPVVLAVNMLDVAQSQGIRVDVEKLSQSLGLPVVGIQANKGVGLDRLRDVLLTAIDGHAPPTPPKLMPAVEHEAETLRDGLNGELPPFLARRLLIDVGGSTQDWLVAKRPELLPKLDAARQRLADAGTPVPHAETKARYGWIRRATADAVTKPSQRPVTFSDKLDAVLTHKLWGTLLFLALMFGMFQAIFVGAAPLMDAIDGGVGALAEKVSDLMSPGPLRSLLADGVIKGVGAVLVFLPQIVILFGFIAILEDCGYMARAAFLMDRLMSKCGLSGKSFIPLLSSVACAVPGIMAARVIENRRDRFATILVAPLMSCSARLPVYFLFAGAFLRDGFPVWLPGLVVFGMYLIGFVTAPLMALLLKRTLLRGATPVFVMELPAYKRPSVLAVLRRMTESGWAFLRRAGTFILAAMILVWAALYFPTADPAGGSYDERVSALSEQEKQLDEQIEEAKEHPDKVDGLKQQKETLVSERNTVTAEWKANSLLGRTGRWLEPAFRPLGWDWKIGMAALASFPAREVIVGTLGIIYQQGETDAGDDEQRAKLGEVVRDELQKDAGRAKYGVPVALSVMVFFALCSQCVSTLVVIRRETKSWAWPAFTFAYMTGLAYLGALATYQLGRLVVDAMG